MGHHGWVVWRLQLIKRKRFSNYSDRPNWWSIYITHLGKEKISPNPLLLCSKWHFQMSHLALRNHDGQVVNISWHFIEPTLNSLMGIYCITLIQEDYFESPIQILLRKHSSNQPWCCVFGKSVVAIHLLCCCVVNIWGNAGRCGSKIDASWGIQAPGVM